MPIDYFLDMERVHKSKATAHNKLTLNKQYVQESTLNQKEPCADWWKKSMAQLVLYDEGWAATSFMQDVSIQEHINLSHNTSKLLVQKTALLFAPNQNDLHAIVFSIAYECLVQQQSLHQLPVSIMTCLRQCSLQLSPIHIIGGSSQRTRQNKNAKSKNNEIVHKSSTKTLWMTTSF